MWHDSWCMWHHICDMTRCVCGTMCVTWLVVYVAPCVTHDSLCVWHHVWHMTRCVCGTSVHAWHEIPCVCGTTYEYDVTCIHMCMSHICMRRVTHMRPRAEKIWKSENNLDCSKRARMCDMTCCMCGICLYAWHDTLCMWHHICVDMICIHMRMAHIWMSRVTHMVWYLVYLASHMNTWLVIPCVCEYVTWYFVYVPPHMNTTWLLLFVHVTHMNESRHTYDIAHCVCGITYEYVTFDTLRMWIRDMILYVCATTYEYYVTRIHMCMSHIWMSRVTHMNESCHTYDTIPCVCGITYEYLTRDTLCMWIRDMILCVCATAYEYYVTLIHMCMSHICMRRVTHMTWYLVYVASHMNTRLVSTGVCEYMTWYFVYVPPHMNTWFVRRRTTYEYITHATSRSVRGTSVCGTTYGHVTRATSHKWIPHLAHTNVSCHTHDAFESRHRGGRSRYAVATISRLLIIIGLFYRISSI